ncbi:MAG: T9SS type A sorting domain-containing protein, partial [Bacteroidales bacterium]|nr:T9SS type A sorting domain-containing protein [Bacteroidales bacterium]
EGIDWYNMANIQNKPGGSSIGWGLEVFYPDTEWISAVHDLDQVAGNPHVAFRIAIATTGAQGIGNQGFALNNVSIARRSKLTLLEHFTNSADQASRSADDVVDAFGTEYNGDVIDIQYHMAYPGADPMNLNNPDPPSTRSFNYGIPEVPYAILDGGVLSHYRYDFNELKTTPDADHIKLLSLEIPIFDIDLSVDWIEGGLVANTTVTCQADQFNENVQLYMAVFESSVTAYTGINGDTHFRNVVLDMLPTPAGKLLGDNWYKGKSDIRTNTWTYQPYVGDANKLAVVAFLQDRNSGKILQAAVDYADKTVGVGDGIRELATIQVYPNPAIRSFYVNLGTPSEYDCRYELMDISGKIVSNGNVPAGYQIYQVDIANLTRGLYIIYWYEGDQVRGLNKIVKTD